MKENWKAGTMISPVPAVMVSCGTMEKSNIITVAWTGILNTDPAMVYISVRSSRHSFNIIKEEKFIEKIFAQFNFKKEKTQEQINEIIQLAQKYITKKTEK